MPPPAMNGGAVTVVSCNPAALISPNPVWYDLTQLKIEYRATPPPTTSSLPGLELEITVFRKEDLNTTTEPRSVAQHYYPWSGNPVDVTVDLPRATVVPDTPENFSNIYFLQQRLVLRVNGNVRRVFPCSILGLETESGAATPSFDNYLFMMQFAGTSPAPFAAKGVTSGEDEGTIIPLPCLPTPTPQAPTQP